MKAVWKLGLGLLAWLQVVPADASLRFYVAPEDTAARLARMLANGGQFLLYASGSIEPGDTDRMASFIAANKIVDARVILNSPGGSLPESLKLGSLIREKKFDTDVGAQGDYKIAICASACAYVFAGGVYRYLEAYSGRLGIHQFSSPSDSMLNEGDAQLVSGAVVDYLVEMGVDGRAFSLAATASPNEVVWVSRSDAIALHLANNGAAPTTAEIKTIEMYPYLRLEQIRKRGNIRVLLVCGTKGIVVQAGVVATPKEVAMNAGISKRSYLEFDGAERFVKGIGGTGAENSVLWIVRGMSLEDASQFGRAKELGVWTEGGGEVRWGGYLDLSNVQTRIKEFLDDCRAYGKKAARH